MNEWQPENIVTTTYGTICQAAQENFDAGVMSERQRIAALIEELLERVTK